MESQELQQMNQENIEMTGKLTGKNAEYFHRLKKMMDDKGVPETKQVAKFNEMLKAAIDSQKNGVTAKALFGTVSQACEAFEQPVKKNAASGDQNDHPALMWVDSSLLLLGMLAVLAGLMGVMKKDQLATYGLLSLFVMSIVGGGVFYLLYHMIYQYERPGADQSKRPGTLKMIGITMLGMVAWMLLYGLTMVVPKAFNPQINAWIVLVIGVVAIAAKFFLKRKFNTASSMSTRAR